MLKRLFFLIPLVFYMLLFAKNANDKTNTSGTSKSELNNTANTVELSRSVYTDYVPNDEERVYKEIQYAKKLYRSGDHVKAKAILKQLKKDDNKELSEQAHYLCLKWYNSLFIPIDATDNTKYVVDTQELDSFKEKFPNSKYLDELEYFFNKDLSIFNKNIQRSQNSKRIELNDSCTFRYKNDSTYLCTFHKKYRSKDGNEHDLIVKVSGKIKKYEPWGNMQDEWETKGLLIDDDSRISIKIDNEEKIIIKDYVEFKQQPKYELKKVEEYGIESEKRSIKEDNAENTTQLATYLTDDLIMPNFKVQFIYGKMNELIPEKIRRADDLLNERFHSKCYVDLRLNEFGK
ncbi:MAG: hypothetical protein JXR69_05895 [Candidatus Delongbacteria bacterium]|nr:hypothetical protein [Candidatus Delongbacteria bacterium]